MYICARMMPARRILVDCVVLSLHDSFVYYPCCKGCLSRMDVEQQDATRSRCSRCGSSCAREQVDHRYRLSFRVARGTCIFGVTVFGNCLNPFFGIHASGLHRLVGNLDEASTRNSLLVKAVQDCFIGRHFIFGIKVPEAESLPWLEEPVGSGSKETVNFIASQMILPKATVLRGFSVLTYYQVLIQKADPSRPSRPPATTPANNFHNATLSISALLSPQSSQSQDSLTPTLPWQQSLGLVTSSAEQDEDSNDHETTRHAHRGLLVNLQVNEEGSLSPPLPLEFSTSHSTCSSIRNSRAWTSPLSFSTRQLTKTFAWSSSAWDDLPFSESLTEFLCEENKGSDVLGEPEPPGNVQYQKEAAGNASHSCQNNLSGLLLDVTNTPAANRRDLSEQDQKAGSQEQLEGDSYDCSADLFSSSLITSVTTDELSTRAEHSHSLLSKQTRTPDNRQKPKRRKCRTRKNLIPTPSLDFVPPSQSTPVLKATGLTFNSLPDSQDSGVFYGNSLEFDHKETSRTNFFSSNTNRFGFNCLSQCSHDSTKENLDRRKSFSHKSTPEPLQQTLNTRISHLDDHDVPLTPAAGPGLSVKLRRRLLTSCDSSCSAQMVKTACDVEVADGSLENEACDWSRDLFSDWL